MLSGDENRPRAIARLPFGARGNARSDGADALVIGRGQQQETDLDRTLLITECAADIDRARVSRTLASLGLACTFFASCEHAGNALNLIEVEGFVRISDTRLDGFRAELGSALHRLLPIGGYAMPLAMAWLAAES
jgi:hypothetical protein